MQKFHGRITAYTPTKVPKLWETNHDTGKYFGRDGHEYSSKLSLWVPVPRNGEHLAGVFLRLSNPSGSSYTRMDRTELAELYTFFRSSFPDAQKALNKAESLLALYKEAEKSLIINSTTNIEDCQPLDK